MVVGYRSRQRLAGSYGARVNTSSNLPPSGHTFKSLKIKDIDELSKYPPIDGDFDRTPIMFDKYLKLLLKNHLEFCLTVPNGLLAYNGEPINYQELHDKIIGCRKLGKRYLYMGLFIGKKTPYVDRGRISYRPDNGHAMAILIDLQDQTLELFDPRGVRYTPQQYSWLREFVDYLNNQGYHFKYYDNTGCPVQIQDITKDKVFCVYWCLLWIQLRLLNPDGGRVSRMDIHNYLTSLSPEELNDKIRRFARMINYKTSNLL